MDPRLPFNPEEGYGHVRDNTNVSQSSELIEARVSPEMGTESGDTLTVRTSPKNAATAKFLYSMSSEALDKAMDNILDQQTSQPTQSKQIRSKTRKPIAPNYKRSKGSYFLYLANTVQFERFANDVQAVNPDFFVKRSQVETLWYKTLKLHFDYWKDENMTLASRKKAVIQANKQTGGYEGFNPKNYWELQTMMYGMESMSVVKEMDPKTSHFRAMEQARKDNKARTRRAAMEKRIRVLGI